jgi:hypothetical protein
MKKFLFALSMLAVALSALPQAKADEVSIDFFYDNLGGGNWIEVEGYGYGWQPDTALSDPNWRPYTDGYWAYTDYGWTWISYEDFGWATYHYGRWADLADYGWVWFPGSDLEWGPAWVSWRFGDDYCGWAPLPPPGPGIVYEGEPIGPQVDIQFDIGPQFYNFIDIRFFGEPVLRDRIFPPAQNVIYVEKTVNVTNIIVKNNVVYNYGPDYHLVSAYSARPIQWLTVERQTPAHLGAAAKAGALTKVQGNKLLVAAPMKIVRPAPGAAPAPPRVKAKVVRPKVERGWAGVQNAAQLKQKIRTENPKIIPLPKKAAARLTPAGASPAVAPAIGKPAVSPARPKAAVSPVVSHREAMPLTPATRITPAPRAKAGARIGATPTEPSGAPSQPFDRAKPGVAPHPRLIPGVPPGKAVPPGAERKLPPASIPPSSPKRTPPLKSGEAQPYRGTSHVAPGGPANFERHVSTSVPSSVRGGDTGSAELARPRPLVPPSPANVGAGPQPVRRTLQTEHATGGGGQIKVVPAPEKPDRVKKRAEKETPPPGH